MTCSKFQPFKNGLEIGVNFLLQRKKELILLYYSKCIYLTNFNLGRVIKNCLIVALTHYTNCNMKYASPS
jgi:hypothetical protein